MSNAGAEEQKIFNLRDGSISFCFGVYVMIIQGARTAPLSKGENQGCVFPAFLDGASMLLHGRLSASLTHDKVDMRL